LPELKRLGEHSRPAREAGPTIAKTAFVQDASESPSIETSMKEIAFTALLALGGNPGGTPAGAPTNPAQPSDVASAQALFEDARRLIASGEHAQACPKLERSLELDRALGTLINLADCYERIGRTASAWSRFVEVASDAHAAGQRERAQVARERAGRLEPTLSRLLVQLPAGAASGGYTLRRDGVPVGSEQWGVAVPIDPGPHALEASAPGKKTWRARVEIGTGSDRQQVAVPMLEDEPGLPALASAVARPRPEEPPQGRDAGRPMRITGGVLALAGLAAGGVGTYYLLDAFDQRDRRDRYCPEVIRGTATCFDRRGLEAHEAARRSQRTATGAYILAGSLLVGGTLFYVLAPSATPSGAALRLAPTADGFAVAFEGTLP
jgi:hypothetical protein